jgi:type IV pilus assembly protein PilA
MSAKRICKNSSGFSLIELMVVVAIIGILATIAVPNFQRFQAKAKQSEAKSNLSSLYGNMKSFHSEWNTYRGDFRDIGMDPQGRLTYHFGFGAAHADAAADAPAAPFQPSLRGGGADGECFNTSVGNCGFVHQVVTGIAAWAEAAAAGTCGAGANPSQTAFTATAIGDLNTGTGIDDVWTITHDKILCNNTPESI